VDESTTPKEDVVVQAGELPQQSVWKDGTTGPN
jgi:hypothetical protein